MKARASLALAFPLAATAASAQKELLLKVKKAQAEDKDLNVAGEAYKQGDEALKEGMTDEAVEHFKKARDAMPADLK